MTERVKTVQYSQEKRRRYVYLTTNIACNLRCVYCYEKNKESVESFDVDQAKDTLKRVLSVKTKCGSIIEFHGGEPFLSFLKIRELCEWAWKQSFPEEYRFFATTNGTLIHGEIQNWIHQNHDKFVLALSLDGNREMQNLNRSNSYDLIDVVFFAKTWPEQGVKMTISPASIHSLAQGVIHIHNLGFKDIAANLAEMIDWSDLDYLKIYERELEKLSTFYLNHPTTNVCSLFDISFASVLSSNHPRWCGCGSDMAEAIDVDGRKHPCHLFFPSVCGKEKSEKAQFIDFTDSSSYISKACQDCPALNICRTCYGSNYIARGDIASRDMNMCQYNKVRMAVVAKYKYYKIVNDTTDVSMLSDEERIERSLELEGIEKMAKFLSL